MADPLTNGKQRQPIDLSVARALVDASLKMLGQLGSRTEPNWRDLADAARSLHLEIALAEFEARLPPRPARPGTEAGAEP